MAKVVSRATVTLTMSAANTMSYQRVNAGLSAEDPILWKVYKIIYSIATSTFEEMTASGDYLWFGLTSNANITDLHVNRVGVLDAHLIHRFDAGAAAIARWGDLNFMYSYMDLDGLVVPPQSLWLMMTSNGLASAGVIRCRFFYESVKYPADIYTLITRAFTMNEGV